MLLIKRVFCPPVIFLITALFLAGCQSSHDSYSSQKNGNQLIKGETYIYQCQAIDEVEVTYLSDKAMQIKYLDQKIDLSIVVSASGARYQSEVINGIQWQWWSKGFEEAMFSYQTPGVNVSPQSCQIK